MMRQHHTAASRSNALRRDGSFLSQIPPPPKSNHKIVRRFLINIVIQPVAISGGLPRMTRTRHTAASRSNALRCDGSFLSQASSQKKIKSQNYKAFPDKHNNSTNCDKSGGKPQMTRERHAAASRSDALRCDGSFYRKFFLLQNQITKL